MDDNLRRLKASLQLFDKLECCSSNLKGDFKDVGMALNLVHTEKWKNDKADDDNYEMILDDELNSNKAVMKTIFLGFPFPNENQLAGEQSWFPQHFAIALGV
jgi:hypothetical protein